MENLVVFKCVIKYLGTQDIHSLILANKGMYNLFCANKNYICVQLARKLMFVNIKLFNEMVKVKIKFGDIINDDKYILDYYRYELNSSKIYIVFNFYGDLVHNVLFFDTQGDAEETFCEMVRESIGFETDVEIIRRANVWKFTSLYCEKRMGWMLYCVKI